MNNVSAGGLISGYYHRHRVAFWLAQALILLIIGAVAGMSLSGGTAPSESDSSGPHTGHGDTAKADAEPTIWTCSMHPQIRRDGPGACPLCGMDLVPVKKSAGGIRTISISKDIKKLMNVQTVPVQHRYVTADVRMVGKIDYA